MPTLHVFNPWHDEALASFDAYYYPTVPARQLARAWGALPALWAEVGDVVWLTDEAAPLPPFAPDGLRWVRGKRWPRGLWQEVERVEPWGWDPLLRQRLLKLGAPAACLPSDGHLQALRQWSSRATGVLVLQALRRVCPGSVGEARVCTTLQQVLAQVQEHGRVMVKSLWSCSGRGVFAVHGQFTPGDAGRIGRLLREHGGVEVEPYYEPVLNFALEFCADAAGHVFYEGLSLFGTNAQGAYMGNRFAPPAVMMQQLADAGGPDAAALEVLAARCCQVLAATYAGYRGPLGIDMMLVRPAAPSSAPLLHPCIEVNLRRTMGHVALHAARCPQAAEWLTEAQREVLTQWH